MCYIVYMVWFKTLTDYGHDLNEENCRKALLTLNKIYPTPQATAYSEYNNKATAEGNIIKCAPTTSMFDS